ncbi:MAG: hypothetical protein RLZZ618_2232 [Pseudomonadota bacterium]|jgi:hypothetical protein
MTEEIISKADKTRIDKMDKIDSAGTMMFLVNTFHTEHTTAFSPALIMAICWEESFFQNMRQVGGPAVGHGQLEVSGRIIANQHLQGKLNVGEGPFNPNAIENNRDVSIRAISHCLAGLYERLSHSVNRALDGYAGVIQRPANKPIPAKWRACATALQATMATPGSFDPIAFEDALRLAREFDRSGPVYNHIHARLWPLLDVLTKLYGTVQMGSKGEQVMVVQDVLNRFQFIDPAAPPTKPRLVVDGQFGSKTHARVKEFQSLAKLTSDGVVGPRTRASLVTKAQAFPMA